MKSDAYKPYFLLTIFVLFTCVACAPVNYNRYQTAQTLGRGNFKILAAATVSHDLAVAESFEYDKKMNDRLSAWATEHPGNRSEINNIIGADLLLDFIWMTGTGIGLTPDVELILAGGVHDKVDVEARATANGYFRLNAKGKLLDVGDHGALALAPGLGYRSIHVNNDEQSAGNNEDFDQKYDGWILTGEVPLILGWKFKYVSPYLAPTYFYHHVVMDYTIESKETSPDLKVTLEEEFDLHSAGLLVGAQFQFAKFVFTPEIAAIYTHHTAVDYGFVYPGISLGASW